MVLLPDSRGEKEEKISKREKEDTKKGTIKYF
jgi:hypothetical protein